MQINFSLSLSQLDIINLLKALLHVKHKLISVSLLASSEVDFIIETLPTTSAYIVLFFLPRVRMQSMHIVPIPSVGRTLLLFSVYKRMNIT